MTAGRIKAALLFGAATGLLGAGATVLRPVLELEESVGLQALFALRGPAPVPEDVVVIGIGRDSAEALGLPLDLTEWPRDRHAQLLSSIVSKGASVVAFDVMFEEARNPEDDRVLANAIADSESTILLDRMVRRVTQTADGSSGPAIINEERRWPLPIFRAAAVATAPFPLPVVPIRTSQFWAFLPTAADTPTLPVATLQLYLLEALEPFRARLVELRPALSETLPPCDGTARLRRNDALEATMRKLRAVFAADPALAAEMRTRLRSESSDALDAGTRRDLEALLRIYGGPASYYVNYYGPPQSVTTVPYHVAVAEGSDFQWEGKTVFVGFSERTQPDQQDTFYSVFSQRSGVNLSGVEIAASAFANLLEGRTVTPLSLRRTLLFLMLWGTALGAGLTLLPTGIAVASGIAAGAAYGGLALQQFASAGSWWPLVVPLLLQLPVALFGAAWSNYARAHGRSERLSRATRRYLPERVVRQMEDDGRSAAGNYELVDGVCLVTDAERYTALSESMSPEALAKRLNEYYEILFGIVERHGGQVTDVVGDSMVAVWVAERGRDAARMAACRAAIDIADAQTLRRGPEDLTIPTRVGLHGGELLLGTIGAPQHLEYRAVGDTVNSASRLQALNKRLGTRILVSEEALAGGEAGRSRRLGTFMLAGKQAALTIYELSGPHGAATEREIVEPFAAALADFEAGELSAALSQFAALTERFPDDGPSRFYHSLCERALETGPADPWDPTVRLDEK